VSTGVLADIFCNAWGDNQKWENKYMGGPHEAGFLKLDCSKIKSVFGWKPRWNVEKAISKTVEWTKEYVQNENICGIMTSQIEEYLKSGE